MGFTLFDEDQNKIERAQKQSTTFLNTMRIRRDKNELQRRTSRHVSWLSKTDQMPNDTRVMNDHCQRKAQRGSLFRPQRTDLPLGAI